MLDNIFKKGAPKESNDPNELLDSRQQILEMRQRLMEYIKKTTQNFSIINDRLNKIQGEADKLPTEKSGVSGSIDVDSFKKMEIKIAEISEEINNLNKTVNITIKEYLQEIYIFIQEQKEKQGVSNISEDVNEPKTATETNKEDITNIKGS